MNEWDGIEAIASYGDVAWDNNLIERTNRHVSASRHSSLFFGSHEGAQRGCKYFIVDPGLQNNRTNSLAAENIGWRLENVVYIELLRKCASDFLDVYYYRQATTGKEVDFVICDKNLGRLTNFS